MFSPALYLDANASYGLLPEVQQAMAQLDLGFNPSSVHQAGQRARFILDEAREELRLLLGAGPRDSIIFTSGATEANSIALGCADTRMCLISSPVEHPSVLEPLRILAQSGRKVCLIEAADIETTDLDPASVALGSFMMAHNETGAITDIGSVARVLRARYPTALIHTDAAQGLGRVPFCFSELGVDLLTISGHKLGALAGIGALVCRAGVAITPSLYGGGQEGGLRAGTQNVVGAWSFGAAARIWRERGQELRAQMFRSADILWHYLSARLPQARWNSDHRVGLPNTLSLTIPGIRGDDLVVALDAQGIRVSSGAACSSGRAEPSAALMAFGLSRADAAATIRISLRADSSDEALHAAAECIANTALAMRANNE